MLRIFLYLATTLITLISCTYASNDNFSLGAKSWGMGNASVAIADEWSAHHNQAGLAKLKSISAGIYFENKFLQPDLGLKAGVIALPTKNGTFGLVVSQFGFDLYNEQKVGLAFAKQLFEKFSFGVQFDYLSTNIQEYGKKGMLTVEAGIQAEIAKNVMLGAHLYNPFKTKLTDTYNERVPTIMKLGLAYKFSEKVIMSIETEKDADFKPFFKSGLEYHIMEALYLRIGISTNPVLVFFPLEILTADSLPCICLTTHFGWSGNSCLKYDVKLSLTTCSFFPSAIKLMPSTKDCLAAPISILISFICHFFVLGADLSMKSGL